MAGRERACIFEAAGWFARGILHDLAAFGVRGVASDLASLQGCRIQDLHLPLCVLPVEDGGMPRGRCIELCPRR